MASAWQRKVRGEFAVIVTDKAGKTHTMKVSALDEKGARKVVAMAAQNDAELMHGYAIDAVFAVVL